jgi:hypothetical protein
MLGGVLEDGGFSGWGFVMDVGTARAAGALRWARSVALATVALLTAMLAHVGAGDRLPSGPALAALLTVVTLLVAPLLRHPASTRRVVALVAAGETCLHFALTALTRTPGNPPGSPSTGPIGGPMSVPMPGMSQMTHTALFAGVMGPHVLMAEAHLAAAVLVGLWLAAGERALWNLLGLTLSTVLTAASTLARHTSFYLGDLVQPVTGAKVEGGPLPPQRWTLARRVVTRRGPPAGSPRPLGA